MIFSFDNYPSQWTKHDTIDNEKKNQKRDQLNNQCLVDTDQCNITDDLHNLILNLFFYFRAPDFGKNKFFCFDCRKAWGLPAGT